MADPRLTQQLPFTLGATHLDALGPRYEGKVRDVYARKDTLVLIASDRLSAFDRVLTTLPFKGEVLNRLAHFWFEHTKDLVANHLLDVPDPNVTVARACEPIKVEVVVRGYLTGSLWRDYEKGLHTAYGLALPGGMKKDTRFDAPLLTPSTKAPKGEHDAPISEADVVTRGLASPRDWQRVREAALALFAAGEAWASSRGLILVDTKYEFGKIGDALYVIDEMHTPDSSRFWEADTYAERFQAGGDQRMLDKENVRQWLIRERGWQGVGDLPVIPEDVRVRTAEIYVNAFVRLTGEQLPLEVGDVGARLTRALTTRGYLPQAG